MVSSCFIDPPCLLCFSMLTSLSICCYPYACTTIILLLNSFLFHNLWLFGFTHMYIPFIMPFIKRFGRQNKWSRLDGARQDQRQGQCCKLSSLLCLGGLISSHTNNRYVWQVPAWRPVAFRGKPSLSVTIKETVRAVQVSLLVPSFFSPCCCTEVSQTQFMLQWWSLVLIVAHLAWALIQFCIFYDVFNLLVCHSDVWRLGGVTLSHTQTC